MSKRAWEEGLLFKGLKSFLDLKSIQIFNNIWIYQDLPCDFYQWNLISPLDLVHTIIVVEFTYIKSKQLNQHELQNELINFKTIVIFWLKCVGNLSVYFHVVDFFFGHKTIFYIHFSFVHFFSFKYQLLIKNYSNGDTNYNHLYKLEKQSIKRTNIMY